MQHLFFSQAVLTAMEQLDWIPDVIHCNDWHTGFLPLLMREKSEAVWDEVASVYTIHNLAYQGEFGLEVLDALDLPHTLFNSEQVEAWGRVNFLKTGCVYADRVNTVSENYANEIQTSEFGCSLEGLMAHLDRKGRLSGILNGIDTDVFNPETDPDIPVHFSARHLSGKRECRAQLLQEVGLPEILGAPLFGVVSRLSSQKGMDLMLKAAEAMFSLPVQLVVQGLGDPALAQAFSGLEARYPNSFRFINRFDPPIAQRIYAGCDCFLMPSAFEPCGLGQMIAMRYGTVPVVRSTGGLADTVFEGHNGFVFHQIEPMELLAAVERARFSFQNPDGWRSLMLKGMKTDLTWDNSAKLYSRLYAEAQSSRGMVDAMTA
jgi:starch synthase